MKQEPTATARHVVEPSTIEDGLGLVVDTYPGITVEVVTAPTRIDEALRMLDAAVEDVRRQLLPLLQGNVIVGGPPAQDAPSEMRDVIVLTKSDGWFVVDTKETGRE